jgi:transposase
MERRFPREIWVERVARWRESGQTAADFARAHGLKTDRLRHWGWRLDNERDAATPTPESSPPTTAVVVPFLEIERPPTTVRHAEVTSPDAIEILTPSGLRVCVPPKFDDEALRRVLAVVVR